ncbi:hypothetical protein [Kordia sp.]|uniref:hypothetical protein n=1 Tax=Kordia sp. TaxID=1965332 RepID=UPI003D6B2F5C
MFKVILTYIIHLNLIIATSAGFLAAGVANLFAIDSYVYYGLFGFFSTLCVYNSQRLFKANILAKTPWLKWVYKHRKLIVYLSLFSGLIASIIFLKLVNNITLTIAVLFGIASIISFFYVVRIFGGNLRELPYIKIHSIALTWTLVIILFPIINEKIYNWETFLFFIPAHYVYFVGVAIPFDIRDLKYDSHKQRTIPQVVGIRNAKMIAISLFVLTIVGVEIVFQSMYKSPVFVVAIMVQTLLIACTTLKRQEIYYSVLIDGAIGLLGISYVMN